MRNGKRILATRSGYGTGTGGCRGGSSSRCCGRCVCRVKPGQKRVVCRLCARQRRQAQHFGVVVGETPGRGWHCRQSQVWSLLWLFLLFHNCICPELWNSGSNRGFRQPFLTFSKKLKPKKLNCPINSRIVQAKTQNFKTHSIFWVFLL